MFNKKLKTNHCLGRAFVLLFAVLLISSPFTHTVFAGDKEDIAKILELKESPDGIVFELLGSDEKYLEKGLARIQTYKVQLQKNFPKIDIAVVSHGAEQFILTKDKAKKNKKAHDSVKRLVDSDIPVYICETHSNNRGVDVEEYPDYITIAGEGPAQIKQYQELGYTLIVIE